MEHRILGGQRLQIGGGIVGTPVPDTGQRLAEMEATANVMSVSLARVEEEIANLEDALETASEEVAEELRDRLLVVKQLRAELLLDLAAIQQLIDAATDR